MTSFNLENREQRCEGIFLCDLEDNVILLSLLLISKGCRILGNKHCSLLTDVCGRNLKYVFRSF